MATTHISKYAIGAWISFHPNGNEGPVHHGEVLDLKQGSSTRCPKYQVKFVGSSSMPAGTTLWCTEDKVKELRRASKPTPRRVYYTSKRPTGENICAIRVKCRFHNHPLEETSDNVANTVKRARPDSDEPLDTPTKIARMTQLYAVQNNLLEGKCKMLELRNSIFEERAKHNMEKMAYQFKIQLEARNRRIKELVARVNQLERSMDVACNGGVRTMLV